MIRWPRRDPRGQAAHLAVLQAWHDGDAAAQSCGGAEGPALQRAGTGVLSAAYVSGADSHIWGGWKTEK